MILMSEGNLITDYNNKLIEGKKHLNNFYGMTKESNNEEEGKTIKTITQKSTIEDSEGNVKKNFLEKPETKDEVLKNLGFGFFPKYIPKRIDALESYKKYDNYYFESFLEQYQKEENQIIYQPISRNFIPKSKVVDPNDGRLNAVQNKLYYSQTVGNIIFSTYVDQNYSLIKTFNHLPSNQRKAKTGN